MPKNIRGTSSLAGKNVQNSESIGNLTADTIKTTTLVATNGTITNLTNTELQTATTNIATNTSAIATNTGNISTNATAITALQNSKQDNLSVTEPLDLTNDVLSLDYDGSFFTVSNGELQLKVILDYGQNVFINTNVLTLQNAGGQVTLDLLDNTNNVGFRIFFNNANQNTVFRIRGATGGYLDIMTLTQTDVDFNSLDLLNVGSINSITATEIGYLDGVTSGLQFQLDQKQAVLTAGNGIDIVSGLGTTISVDEAELTTKQNVITAGDGLSFTGDRLDAQVTQTELDAKQATITDSTDIGLNELEVNDKIVFQRNGTTDTNTRITRSNAAGKMKLVANTYAFRDAADSNNVCVINDSGTITAVSLQADFFSSITDTELDTLNNITSNVQTQLDSKQASITSSTSISCADINLNTNAITGVTSMTCEEINIQFNSSDVSILDFGEENDNRFRILYNAGDNTTKFFTYDGNGANEQVKLRIERTKVVIPTGSFDLNSNDIINVNSLNSITAAEIGYLDGVTSNLQTQLTGKADAFNLTLPLELDSAGFPLPVIKLNYSTDQFKLTGNNLELNRNIVECKTTNFNLSSSGNWGSTSTTYPYIQGWGSITTLSGTSFLSNASDGIFGVANTGLYKITLNVAAENVSVNNRIVVGVYLSVDDADASFRTVPGEFLLLFVRDDNQGFGTSSSTTIYKTLTDANTLRFKTRLGTGSDNRTYNDQQDDAKLNIYTSLTLERIG